MSLPPCGLYKTSTTVGEVPEGRLVLFHNHGDPGPGIYLPEGWKVNRASFSKRGRTIGPAEASTLIPLPPEGLYRVSEEFFCCEKECRRFAHGLLVQLGYNGRAEAILFLPTWTEGGLAFPETGQKVDGEKLRMLDELQVAESGPSPRKTQSDLYH